jgi:hypothetical protein
VHTRVDQLWVEGKAMSDCQFLKHSAAWDYVMPTEGLSLQRPVEFPFVGCNYRNETICVIRRDRDHSAVDGISVLGLTELNGGAVACCDSVSKRVLNLGPCTVTTLQRSATLFTAKPYSYMLIYFPCPIIFVITDENAIVFFSWRRGCCG